MRYVEREKYISRGRERERYSEEERVRMKMNVRKRESSWIQLITDQLSNRRKEINRKNGSGALPGKMLLVRIIERKFKGCFFLFLAPEGGSHPAGHYPNPLPNPAGQR